MEASNDKKEDAIIKKLLRENAKVWRPLRSEPVSDQTEEMCCGWKLVRPSAEYDLTRSRRKKKIYPVGAVANTLSLAPEEGPTGVQHPYMSGELDENFSYVYKGGLSPRASAEYTLTSSTEDSLDQRSRSSAALAQYHTQTVVLEPQMLPSHCSGQTQVEALARSRAELAKILALQLKPELLVEQLIIENRLRTMSLAAFSVLEGIGTSRKKTDRTKSYSKSTPALGTLPNTHVHYQKRQRHHQKGSPHKPPKAHLQWCGMSGGETASPIPPNLQNGLQYHERNGVHLQHNSKQTLYRETAGIPMDPTQHQLPKVSPNLVTETASKVNKMHKRLSPLLYNPESSGHKPIAGSTLYYPHVSYSNSRHTKFK